MLRQKSFLTFLINIAGSFLGFISVVFVSRLMGPEAMGAISSAVAIVGLFAIVGDFGFGIAHYKKVSEGQNLAKCIGTFFVIRLVTTLIMAISIICFYFGSYYLFGKYPVDTKYTGVFLIVFVSGLLGNLLYVITYTFTARVEKVKEGISILSQKLVNATLKIIVAISGLGVVYLAWSQMAGVIAGLLFSILMFRKYPIARFDPALFKSYRLFAMPAILIGITETVSMNIDKLFISYFSGTTNVGYYSSAQSIVTMLSYVGIIFVSILLPTYSSLHAQGKIDEIRSLAYRVERYISIILMPLVAFFFFFSDPIRIIILGDKFAESSPIISVLAINAMLIIFNQPYSSQLMGTNQIKLGMSLGLIMLCMNLLLNLLLIPESLAGFRLGGMGGLGSAISLMLSSFFGTLLFRYYAFRTSKTRSKNVILIHLLFATISFGSMYLLFLYLNSNVWGIILYFTGGIIIYTVLMLLTHQLKQTDIKYYFEMINPNLMKKYIAKELNNS